MSLSRRSFLLGASATAVAAAMPSAPKVFAGEIGEYNGVVFRGDVFTLEHLRLAKEMAKRFYKAERLLVTRWQYEALRCSGPGWQVLDE